MYDPRAAVPVPTTRPATTRLTVDPDAAVPVSRGRLKLVIPSPIVPVSSDTGRDGTEGTAGEIVSMVSENDSPAALVLPAASVAVAVTE